MLSVLVFLGSGLGGVARYYCSIAIVRYTDNYFPWETILVNVLGSFIIGFFNNIPEHLGKFIVNPNYINLVTIGFCGGYTTFSTFSLQTMALLHKGYIWYASFNVLISVILCLFFVYLGQTAAGKLYTLTY